MLNRLPAILLILGAFFAASAAQAQSAIGTAMAVRPTATGQLGGTNVVVIEGASLFEGQTIVTDAAGEVQILFADDTRMVIGPNSSLVIERYLMRNPNSAAQVAVNAIGGVFRFITGNTPAENFTIRTPSGTIGIRGTGFDFTVDWLTGRTDLFLFFGGIVACPANGPCVAVAAACTVGSILGVTTADVFTDPAELARLIGALFPMVLDQSQLLPDFQLAQRNRCLEELLATLTPTWVQALLETACATRPNGALVDPDACLEAVDLAIIIAELNRALERTEEQIEIGFLLCQIANAHGEITEEVIERIEDSGNPLLRFGCTRAPGAGPNEGVGDLPVLTPA